ncbi:hypothetical protein TTHERM_00469250 (macronuclear) [Tetrahymena thermophila SB210]|uniref:Uncharacterized protein n=1 Tax=Tetrahymena thermophila (strain SB210) TaxID=312017 RepID=I7LXL5_TETTS|nr:hypothetical protein TTHERM_00469250 [Tetrahymena thermophila SB210]EAS04876.2 hypothetical protein TTHERM_00469250 [Tetrahymena thermophila SB210]|eukprot:XP_001025121.2 hypothetical protein TTHERM_00469250 [Tetrahymena thermophila SB210]
MQFNYDSQALINIIKQKWQMRTESIDQLVRLFGKIIDYYEQSNYLRDVNFQIQYSTIRIYCENKLFLVEILKLHPPQEEHKIQPINLFAMKSKCKFNKIYIGVYAEILKNRIFSIIDFLKNNQEELLKLNLSFFNDFQEDEIELALQRITQITQENKISQCVIYIRTKSNII